MDAGAADCHAPRGRARSSSRHTCTKRPPRASFYVAVGRPVVVRETKSVTMSANCAICGLHLISDVVTVNKKGLQTLLAASQAREDDKCALFEDKLELPMYLPK